MICDLNIHHLRNLSDCRLSLGRVNVFVGDNGCGKTSLLEAIFLLSRGKSFRHHEPKRYISHHAQDCTVWAKFADDSTLAISKQKLDAKTHLRHNQNPVATQAVVARLLPVLLIDPSGMAVLEEGLENRRQLLDFLCFHSQPEFHRNWLDYQRILKQRNALLKLANAKYDTAIHQQILAWDSLLSDSASQLHAIRQMVFERWQNDFQTAVQTLLPHYAGQIHLAYQAGFDLSCDLKTILQDRLHSDIELGYTRIGSHRADLSIMFKTTLDTGKLYKEQAVNVLSRGQKKLLIIALKLSGLSQLQKQPHTPIVLIDDMDSELDEQACQVLLKALLALDCQIFITSLDKNIATLIQTHSPKASVFTIKQGVIEKQQ